MQPIERIIHCKPEHVHRKQEFLRWQGYECVSIKWINQYRVTMVFRDVFNKENWK